MSNEVNLRTAKTNDTLLGLISEKLTEENGGKKVNVNSVWKQILDVVDEQQQATGDVYKGGSERKNWGRNYVLLVGKTVTFSKALWDKIKTLVGLNNSSDTMNDESSTAISIVKHAHDALPNGVSQVNEPWRDENQQYEFNAALNKAKDILVNNASSLELTQEEVYLIKDVKLESIDKGISRADKSSRKLYFNINEQILKEPNVGFFIHLLLHEANHVSNFSSIDGSSKSEEQSCERKAIKLAYNLQQQGIIDDYTIPCGSQGFQLSSLSTDEQIDNYISNWLKQYYSNVPE